MFKVLIRPLEKEDALTSWKWRNDSDIWEYTGNRPDISITPEIELKWIETALRDQKSKRFAITADDVYIGNIQLTNITKSEAQYHIFIGDKRYWGKGIAYSATQQIIRFAKNNLKLNTLYLEVNPENIKAIKLYEKSGFEVAAENGKMILHLEKAVKPRVSVFSMVYNHEPYLREFLNGILMQKCHFDYEIVIGEDYSEDNSREILLEYAKKYPGKFKLLLHDKNIGAVRNQEIVLKNCFGSYIAMCEGDDYWTDPYKLHKQVDFLENNNEYVLTYHNANVVNYQGDLIEESKLPLNCQKDFSSLDLKKGAFLLTLTLCFRNVLDFSSIEAMTVENGDTFLISLLGNYGKGKYMNDILPACYRLHSGGVWSHKSDAKKLQMRLSTFKGLKKYYLNERKLRFHFEQREKGVMRQLIHLYAKNKDSEKLKSLAARYVEMNTGFFRFKSYIFLYKTFFIQSFRDFKNKI